MKHHRINVSRKEDQSRKQWVLFTDVETAIFGHFQNAEYNGMLTDANFLVQPSREVWGRVRVTFASQQNREKRYKDFFEIRHFHSLILSHNTLRLRFTPSNISFS